jgi:deoxyribose-phosphate aldolase
MVTYKEIASMIDHSLLKPQNTDKEIEEGCRIADKYKVATVCVRPSDVPLAKKVLKDSSVLVTTVIGFPHGTTTTAVKVAEAREAIENGCRELDVVCNIGKVKSHEWDYVRQDLKAVIDVCHASKVLVKVIFENCFLCEEEIIQLCKICNDLDADWVKTSTGFGSGGAEDKDLRVMRQYAKPSVQLKAAGGIRTLERAIEVRALGCTRFGCTATQGVLERLK